MEHENKKDSNMISSALDDCLRVRLNGEDRTANRLRLFINSCFGKNKNMNVIFMLQALMKKRLPNISVEYAFPIRGHCFLPADRVFGHIGQQIRKKDSVLHSEEYYELLREPGNVYVYDIDWLAFYFKSQTQALLNSQRSFKLSEAKMMLLHSDQIGFKTTYAACYCFHSCLERGKRWADFKPAQLPMVSTVRGKKT